MSKTSIDKRDDVMYMQDIFFFFLNFPVEVICKIVQDSKHSLVNRKHEFTGIRKKLLEFTQELTMMLLLTSQVEWLIYNSPNVTIMVIILGVNASIRNGINPQNSHKNINKIVVIALNIILDEFGLLLYFIQVKIMNLNDNIRLIDLINSSLINDSISNSYNDFRTDINSLFISVNIQTLYGMLELNLKILITKLTINHQQDDMINDQVNLISDYVSNDTDMLEVLVKIINSTYNYNSNIIIYLLEFVINYIISALLNSVISRNLTYILNNVVQIILGMSGNIVNMCIHKLQIIVNHVLIANGISTIIAIVRTLSIHSFDYDDDVLYYSGENELMQFTISRKEVLISAEIYITTIETGDDNNCMTKQFAKKTEINNNQNLCSFGIKFVKSGTHDLIEIIWLYAYQSKQQNRFRYAGLFLLLSTVDSINNDLIDMYLNNDYLRCGYEELFNGVIRDHEQVYTHTIFYKMKDFILNKVIILNSDGKGANTTNNELLLICIGANSYKITYNGRCTKCSV